MTEKNIIKCVYMNKMYGIRAGDTIITEDAYWFGEELIITSFITLDESEIMYAADRMVEMKIEMDTNIRITTPISGKIVGKITIDKFRNVTLFTMEV